MVLANAFNKSDNTPRVAYDEFFKTMSQFKQKRTKQITELALNLNKLNENSISFFQEFGIDYYKFGIDSDPL